MQNIGFSDSGYVAKPPQPSSTFYRASISYTLNSMKKAKFTTTFYWQFSQHLTAAQMFKQHDQNESGLCFSIFQEGLISYFEHDTTSTSRYNYFCLVCHSEKRQSSDCRQYVLHSISGTVQPALQFTSDKIALVSEGLCKNLT